MKYSKKACVYDSVVVSLNAEKEKHLNYEACANSNTIGYVCVHCQDSKKLNFFGVLRKFKCYCGGYAKVIFLEMIDKEKANLRLLVYDEVRLIVAGASNLLPLDKSYHHLAIIIIQRKIKREQAYSSQFIMEPITFRYCNVTGKIKGH